MALLPKIKRYDNMWDMITVIEVKKNANENNMNLVRRFTRKVQESGIIQKVKSKRYNKRADSKIKVKVATLKRLARKKNQEKLFKLGKEVKFLKKRGHK